MNSVGHNSSLILGLTPNADGVMPKPDVKRLKAFGDEIKRRFSNPTAITSGSGETLTLKLAQKQQVNHVVLMEDIAKGERIRRFVLEGKTHKGWQTIVEVSCIGHKFIHRFDEVHVSAVRLNVLASEGEPQIKSLQLFLID